MITVQKDDRKAAFAVPFEIYEPDLPYVSPMWSDIDRILDPSRNPLCRDDRGKFQLFTAHRDGKPVGRIVASVHMASNTRHSTNQAQFGFFDCEDADDAANALLDAAEEWAHRQGAEQIAGNFNLTAAQMVGVVTEGFNEAPYTDMMWTPPHIAAHLRRRGYEQEFPMTTFETDLEQVDVEALMGEKQQAILSDPSFMWHKITRRFFREHMEGARLLLNDGFDANPMFVPVSTEEFDFQASEMMWIMDPRLSVMVHHNGNPAGVIICIPDLNPFLRATRSRMSLMTPFHYLRFRLNRERAVIVYYSVATDLQGIGLNGAMLVQLIRQAKIAGYKRLGTTWIGDTNPASLHQMRRLGAQPLHRLHLFRKSLQTVQ